MEFLLDLYVQKEIQYMYERTKVSESSWLATLPNGKHVNEIGATSRAQAGLWVLPSLLLLLTLPRPARIILRGCKFVQLQSDTWGPILCTPLNSGHRPRRRDVCSTHSVSLGIFQVPLLSGSLKFA